MTTTWLTPQGVTSTLAQVLDARDDHQAALNLTYLRRKPGRGLVAVYGQPSDPEHLFTLTVEESALTEHPDDPAPQPSAWQGQWPGLLEVSGRGLTLQSFPHDLTLPALAAAMAPMQTPVLREALLDAVRDSLPGGPTWRLADVDAVALRYKPGDRCVVRYRLHLVAADGDEGATGESGEAGAESSGGAIPEATTETGPETAATEPQHLTRTVVGKVYREVDQARAAAELLDRLAATRQSPRWSPASRGVVEPLPIALSEDLGSSTDIPPTLPGTAVIRPADPQALQAVEAAARALVDLHTGGTSTVETATRTGADEAARAAKRAAVLTAYVPSLAGTVAVVADDLAAHLRAASPDALVPSHGSYKPSQLLFRDGAVALVDFDQFCLADPALDVGYFLAYLRPPGLWYHRAGTRQWFEEAAAVFTRAYDEALAARGWTAAGRAAVLSRAHVYEAALLLKIAARRPNRLHSPRTGEVAAVLEEVRACLVAAKAAPAP